jgi:hypothetical protein
MRSLWIYPLVALVSIGCMKNEIAKPPSDADAEGWVCVIPEYSKPQYPGDKDSLGIFLNSNFRCENICDSLLDDVRVVIQFGVDTFGVTQNITILETGNTLVDQELIRVLGLIRNWIPARFNGSKVYNELILPVCFKLEE